MPKTNEPDLRDIPLHLRSSMRFHPAETLVQVLDVSLVGGLKALETPRGEGGAALPDNDKLPPKRKSTRRAGEARA